MCKIVRCTTGALVLLFLKTLELIICICEHGFVRIGKVNDRIASGGGGGRYSSRSDDRGYRLLDRDETMLPHDDGTEQYNLMVGEQDDWVRD